MGVNSRIYDMDLGVQFVGAPGAETPTSILFKESGFLGASLVRAPGTETPTPILEY